jgi:hypothetical protein
MDRKTNKGSWVFFETITYASTVPEIIQYFAKHGIAITDADIDIGSQGTLISFSDRIVVDLVNEKLGGDPLRKWPTIGRRWLRAHEL